MLSKTDIFTFHIKVFGCQMNQADAEKLSAFLVSLGGAAKNADKAQLIIFISCGVRQSAEQRILSLIKKTKIDYPQAKMVLTGCIAHRSDVQKNLSSVIDLFVPAGNLQEFSKDIVDLIGVNRLSDRGEMCSLKPLREEKFRAFIPIMTGCNNFCAYCVVPFARGREESLAPEEVIKEAEFAIGEGAKEIFLLGQNVNSYRGEDASGKIWDFPDLLKKINDLKGNFWIKFLSSHPKDTNKKLFETMRDGEKISPNLHLPIQSGSSRILQLMNRKYSAEYYLNLVREAKKIYPEIIISSDIIVGFPGETLSDFRASIEIVKKSKFEMLYSLKYSKRPETAAAKMKETVDAPEKKRRQQKLDNIWKKIAIKNNQKFIGKKIRFIVNSVRERQNDFLVIGKSFEEKTVCVTQKKSDNIKVRGDWSWAEITSVSPLSLTGRIIKK